MSQGCFMYFNISSYAWSPGCWTPSLWVVRLAWLIWTKSTPTVSTPAWCSRTSRPKSPHTPSCRTWLVPTHPPVSPPALHLCSTSIPLAPTPVTAWVWAGHRCSTPSCPCTAAWSPFPCRWACLPTRDLLKLRCTTRKRGVPEPGDLQTEPPSTLGKGTYYLKKCLMSKMWFHRSIVTNLLLSKMYLSRTSRTRKPHVILK